MLGEDFAARYGVTLDYTSEGSQRDQDGWEHNVYPFTLANGDGATYRGTFRAGLGFSGDIDARTILEAVAIDARTAEYADDFEGFCADLGYDTDSRKAYAVWEACQQARRDLYGWVRSEAEWADLLTVGEEFRERA